jgi:transcriptional regulator with XRE-family HTH domain
MARRRQGCRSFLFVRRIKREVDEGTTTDVAQRLRHFRALAGITQESLARIAKLTPKFVSQIENGHVNPSIAVLARVVHDGLDLPLSAFFAEDMHDDIRSDLAQLSALLAGQPLVVRRRALRVLKALCDEGRDYVTRPKR